MVILNFGIVTVNVVLMSAMKQDALLQWCRTNTLGQNALLLYLNVLVESFKHS